MQSMTDPTDGRVFWSYVDVIVWIASGSLDLVHRHFRSFAEVEAYFLRPENIRARFRHSLKHARDYFLEELNRGLPGAATEACLRGTMYGYLLAPEGREQVGFSRVHLGLGTWMIRTSIRGVPATIGEVGTGVSLQTGMVEMKPGDPTQVPIRRTQSEGSVTDENWLGARFDKGDMIALWPPLAEDEAQRLAREPAILKVGSFLGFPNREKDDSPSGWGSYRRFCLG